ncbi:hypothetical protein ACO0LI_10515 [Undibacterium sp. Tian12W]
MKSFVKNKMRLNRMKRFLLLALILSALSGMNAQAQFNHQGKRVSTRAECEYRCNAKTIELPNFRTNLDKILAAIKKESDPEKLSELRQEEKKELERVKEKIENVCQNICINNPE